MRPGRGTSYRALARQFTSVVERATGLCENPSLRKPRDWQKVAEESITVCNHLIQEIVVSPPGVAVIKKLDDISDTICQVYDSAEFCRNVHRSTEWREAALQTCINLGEYVHQLNTHQGLYNALLRALQHQERLASSSQAGTASSGPGAHIACGYSAEAVRVGHLLKRDFEKSGIHLDDQRREEVTRLTSQNQQIGMRIGQNLADQSKFDFLQLPKSRGQGNAHAWPMRVPGSPSGLSSVLAYHPDRETRKQAYLMSMSTPSENVRLFEILVEGRHQLSQLLGSQSYAHYQLAAATLATSPSAVDTYLDCVHASLQEEVSQDRSKLQKIMNRHVPGELRAWDRPFYKAQAKAEDCPIDGDMLSQYFPVSGVLAGIGSILQLLFGVTMQTVPMGPGEAWADDVEKLAFVQEDEGLLGHIYLDMQPRQHKMGGAAQFTLRCGRRLSDGAYQKPLVALIFNHSSRLLGMEDVKVLFHEFGHALNSLLSRTEFQHLAGTRGAMDVVEIPSHLMEYFSRDARSLGLIARHHSSGDPIPDKLLADLSKSVNCCSSFDRQEQVFLTALDQKLFGTEADRASPSEHARGVMDQYSAFPPLDGLHPHIRFGHLVGYGATYYSYAYAQALAAAIWAQHFTENPLDRAAGEHIRRNLLQWGGSLEPRQLIEGVLGSGSLQAVAGGLAPAALTSNYM